MAQARRPTLREKKRKTVHDFFYELANTYRIFFYELVNTYRIFFYELVNTYKSI